MRFNLVDLAVILYVLYGVWMGRRRGMARETAWAIGWAVSLLTGSGIYRWTARGLDQVGQASGLTYGIFGFVAVLVGAYLLVLRLRWRIRTQLEKRLPDPHLQKTGGMIAGGARTLLLSSFLILFIMLLPIGFLRDPFQKGSFIGRILNRIILPVYQETHKEERPKPAPTDTPPKRPAYDPTRSKQF
jgi:uncharacterized membrane protein required for colicin V production